MVCRRKKIAVLVIALLARKLTRPIVKNRRTDRKCFRRRSLRFRRMRAAEEVVESSDHLKWIEECC